MVSTESHEREVGARSNVNGQCVKADTDIQECAVERVTYEIVIFFFQAEDGIRDIGVTGVQTCALPISAYVIAPNVRRANTFLKVTMDAFDIESARSYDTNLGLFEAFLVKQYKEGVTPVLLMDEAQNANRDALKMIHYLLNFETSTVKLLQIVLAGQEELAAKVLRYRELASRMFPIAINAMSSRDLEEMIQFRWMVAGGKEPPFVS